MGTAIPSSLLLSFAFSGAANPVRAESAADRSFAGEMPTLRCPKSRPPLSPRRGGGVNECRAAAAGRSFAGETPTLPCPGSQFALSPRGVGGVNEWRVSAAWAIVRGACGRPGWPSWSMFRLLRLRGKLELDSRGVHSRNHFVHADHAAGYGHGFHVTGKPIDHHRRPRLQASCVGLAEPPVGGSG